VLVYGASPAFAARITCSGSKHQQNLVWHRTKSGITLEGFRPCRAAHSGADAAEQKSGIGLD
jgi:methylphosphotriester-DNA--protein-cysteine methyltransferase